MSRKIINLGTNANDGTGDNLRDAMSKVNDNIIELYSRTGGDSTLSGNELKIVGNVLSVQGDMTITTNNNGNINISSPVLATANITLLNNSSIKINTNEVDLINALLVNGNAKIKGNTTLGDNVNSDTLTINGTISNTLTPTNGITYDLGTSSLPYRDAHIGGTVFAQTISTANAAIQGGRINNTIIGDSTPTEGRFTVLRALTDTFLGDLLIRDNIISTGINDSDIEIRPFGNGNLLVTTKMIVGLTSTPVGEAIIKAVGEISGYVQSVIQNLDDGSESSADIFIPRNDGDDENRYIDIGINSSTYSSLDYAIHTSGSGYFYSSDVDLFIGTYTNNDVVFHAGNDMDFSSIAMRIKGETAHIIMGPEDGSTVRTDTGELLQVHGVIRTTEHVKGGVVESNITEDLVLTPTKSIYSFTPTQDDVNIYLEETVGSIIIFNNRSTNYNYNLFSSDNSSLIVSVEPLTASTVASDSNGWFLVSTI